MHKYAYAHVEFLPQIEHTPNRGTQLMHESNHFSRLSLMYPINVHRSQRYKNVSIYAYLQYLCILYMTYLYIYVYM